MPDSCPRCGSPIREEDDACRRCGYSLHAESEPGRATAAGPGSEEAGGARGAGEGPAGARRSSGRTLSAAPRTDETTGVGPAPPWERRRELGFFTALWRTWRDSVLRPVAFFRDLPPRNGFGPPLLFAILATAVGFFFSFYWGALEGFVTGGVQGELGAVALVVGFVVAFLFLIPLYIGVLFVSAGILHLGLMVAGGGRRGFEATFRATAYASGPAVFSLFPFFGPLVSFVWGMVLWFIGVREVQRTTNGRAALGFLIPVAALFLVLMLLGALLALLVGGVGERAVTV